MPFVLAGGSLDATVCEDIEVLGRTVTDVELVVLGQCMARGDFGRVKRINLVSCQLLLFTLFVAQVFVVDDAWAAVQQSSYRRRSDWAGKGTEMQYQLADASYCEPCIFCYTFIAFPTLQAIHISLLFIVYAAALPLVTLLLKMKNQIGDASARSLGKALKFTGSLHTLNLVCCFHSLLLSFCC